MRFDCPTIAKPQTVGGNFADRSDPLNFANANCPQAKEINNNVTDSCLRSTIKQALDANKDVKGFLSEVITRYADRNNGIVINIGNKDIGASAETQAGLNTNGTFEANITLNHNYFKDTSKEYVIAQLLHKVVHAYLKETNRTAA